MPASPLRLADELIRQITIDAPERGLLMLRVRDEARMTLDAYKTLYDSSVTFGIRKHMQAEEGIPELEAMIAVRLHEARAAAGVFASCTAAPNLAAVPSQELTEKKAALEAQILALRNKIEVIERRQVERRLLDDKRRQEELAYLKHQAKHLDLFLKSMPKA